MPGGRKGEYVKALADYDQVIRLEAPWMPPPTTSGASFAITKVGLSDKAIVQHGEAFRLDPKEKVFAVNRGDAWQEKGDYAKALEDYDEALRNKSEVCLYLQRSGHSLLSPKGL